jgi:hypothetical protein
MDLGERFIGVFLATVAYRMHKENRETQLSDSNAYKSFWADHILFTRLSY